MPSLERRSPALALALALALAVPLALVGCDTAKPTGTPTPTQPPASTPSPAATTSPSRPVASGPPAAQVYGDIRAAMIAIRGLKPTSAVDPVTIDEAQLIQNFRAEFAAGQTPQQIKDAEDLLITLGLLPAGSSVLELTLDLQGNQVVGYYSPEKDELFLVSRGGRIGPLEETTYAHEFTHQLQDQNFDLEATGFNAIDQSDRVLGTRAFIEGDASYAQTQWMIANLDAEEIGEILAAALDPSMMEALARAPAYLRDTATFQYQDGLAFVTRLATTDGFAGIDAAYADPPRSTEQILHPEKYLDREAPIAVALPDNLPAALGAGWAEAGRDTLGELILRIWLAEGKVGDAEARAAAAGWGGDRVVLLRGPGGALAVGLLTEWDTAQDATEFASGARTAIAGMGLAGQVATVPNRSTRIIVALGDSAAEVVAALQGAPAGG